MRLLLVPVLLLLAAAAGAEGESTPPPKAGDPQEKDFDFRMARARELAAKAVASADPAVAREAYDLFLGAAHVRPKDPAPLAEAGILALDFGDSASGGVMAKALEALAPESGACRFLRGCLLQTSADYLEARTEYAAAKAAGYRAGQAEVRFFQCTVGLGLQYGVAGLHDAALKTLAEAVAMKPDDPLVPIAYYNMGVSQRRLDKPKEAEEVLRLCMKRFPSYGPAYGELGEMLTDLRRYDDAVAVLGQSVKADPSYSRGWLLLASTQAARGRFPEAEEAFRGYDGAFKPTGLSEFYRGMVLQKKGDPKRAVECLQRSIALDPSMVRAVYWIGLCRRDLGEEKEAEACMERWRKAEVEERRLGEEESLRALRKTGTAPAPAPPGGDRDKGKEEGAKDGGGG